MTLDLLPKPKRFLIFGRWIFIKDCSCCTGCTGHILILTPFYESGEKIDIHPIDITEWHKAIEQELNAYEERMNPSTEEGISTEGLVQEIDQAHPEEVSNYNKSSPKKVEKKYTPKPKPEQKTGGSSGKGFGPRY